ARLNTTHATTTMSDPGTSMSRSRRYPEEYAIALPGVPTGRVKASPDGNATTGAMTRGSMPYCVAIPRATGMSRATTAEWLMASVSTIPKADRNATTAPGVRAQWLTVMLAIQTAAPEWFRADPSAMAPPYMSSTPQLTYCSMSRHVSSPAAKMSTTPASAMVASPNSSPPTIQAARVPSMMKPMARSRTEGRPIRI